MKNLSKHLARLKALPKQVQAEMRIEMEKQAGVATTLMKAAVPVDSGALRDSIGWAWGAPKGSGLARSAGADAASLAITIRAGSREAYQALWIEFGTVRMAAQPFFWPTMRAVRRPFNRSMGAAARRGAKKAWGK